MIETTLLEVVTSRTTPDTRTGFTYLRDGEVIDRMLTHHELLQRAKGLAQWLRQQGLSGQRALMVFPPGLEFVEALLACMIAGVTAVPVAPAPLTGDKKKVKRMLALMDDCQPSLVLGVGKTIGNAAEFVTQNPQWKALVWLEVDRFEGWESSPNSAIDLPPPEAIALLQYTSGSTGTPKGVMLSHANLLHNLRQWDHGLGHDANSRTICWVPHFHDLGLLYGVLFPLYRSISAWLLPAAAVAQQPLRWLKAISNFKGTHSMGPNFIYQHCCQRISEADCQGLDLSSWRMALNAAEPVRMEAVNEFNGKFGRYGLSPLAMTVGYGLAEATCFVTCQGWDTPARFLPVSAMALQHNEVRLAAPEEAKADAVACGRPLPGTIVKIVDPERRVECSPNGIGEIWIHGGSVSSGYWGRPETSAATFGAVLEGDLSGQCYLRTGDLGFVHEGDVFTTGRIKDLIIVRGENYYPQDAEREIERAHTGFAPSGCAVFSVLHEGAERVVVVQELTRAARSGPYEEMFDAARRAVGATFDLPVHAVALIQPGTTAKTSSGKIQRSQSKQAFLDGNLQVIATWLADSEVSAAGALPPTERLWTAEEVEAFLIRRVADLSKMSLATIRADRPFSEYGLGSLDSTLLADELSVRLSVKVSPTAFYEHPSIRQLVSHLSGQLRDREPRERSAGAPALDADAIVVVGMACRFPGADGLAAYWEMLLRGGSGVTSRHNDDGTTRHGGFLDGLNDFDNEFFSITNREAACMDPQQRIALQVAWHALEDAGIRPADLAGTRTGVFFGASAFDYGSLQLAHAELDAYSGQGSVLAVIANRIAYHFDLRGPSLVVDTACSSALTAVHLACRSLRDGESRAAIVGAVNVLLASDWDRALIKAGMLAPDGQCKTFDASANGYVRSEGCGALVLKRYKDAVADGDRIYGAILGSAVNQDGRSNGLTAPNGVAQEAVLLDALANAKTDPADLRYAEAHGTGTSLGDPIECRALSRVLAQGSTDEARTCYLGSAKANVGHLEAAAGMAGLIKVLLALHNGQIPQQRNLHQLNPLIELGERMVISREGVPWHRDHEARRRASVSAFGFSGTNACVVAGDADESQPRSRMAADAGRQEMPSLHAVPFVLSARDKASLRRLAARQATHLRALPAQDWPAFAYTSTCRRELHDTRFAVAADGAESLMVKLQALADGTDQHVTEHAGRAAPRIAFIYTGQGMALKEGGRELFERLPAVAEALARCDEVLAPKLGLKLETLLYGDRNDIDLGRPSLAQPVHVALQYALAQGLASMGLQCDVVLGHSLGEYAALVAAGAMSVEAAVQLAMVRGELCEHQVASGAMATVFADEDTVSRAIVLSGMQVDLAAVNGPHHCVVAGAIDAVSRFCAHLAQQHSIEHRRLRVERPHHSRHMDPIMAALMDAAEGLRFEAPAIDFISSATGRLWAPGKKLHGHYFVRQLREPVRFADALQTLAGSGATLAIEIGTQPVLCNIGEACLDGAGPRWLPMLRHQGHDHGDLLECLLQVAGAGSEINWHPLFTAHQHRVVSVPGYVFEKVPHWFKPRSGVTPAAAAARPAWADVVRSGEAALVSFKAVESAALSEFDSVWTRLEEACPPAIAAALAEIGLFHQAGETVTAQGIVERFGLKANRLPLLGQWLAALGNVGLLKDAGKGEYRNTEAFDAVRFKQQAADLLGDVRTSEDCQPIVDYVRESAGHQARLLTGETSPLDLLFPDGGSRVADALYKLNPVSRMQNHIAAEVLRSLVDRHAAVHRRPMRILEMGAGTGGTSAELLKVLPATGVVYHFTDVSHFFTDRAKARFAALPFVEYGLFDINRGYAEQGYEPGSFDLILAANAVHAARYIDKTLSQLRELLTSDGALMFIEGTVNTPIQFLTLGHIDSFRHYEDHRKARNLPFMSVEEWRSCLLQAGFERCCAVPGEGASSRAWPQNVVLAFGAGAGSTPAISSGAPYAAASAAATSTLPAAPPVSRAARADAPLMDAKAPSDQDTMTTLRQLLARLIHVDAGYVDPQMTFMELGVDSIVLMEFTRAVSRQHGIELTVSRVFEHYPSVCALARFLDAGQPEAEFIDPTSRT